MRSLSHQHKTFASAHTVATALRRIAYGITLILCAVGGWQSQTQSAAASQAAEQTDYRVGVQDVLAVQVWGRQELSGKFEVDTDGTVKLPLLERIKLAGLTVRQVEEEIRKRLADGYLKNPQVTVAVDAYRSRYVWVQGAIRQPGKYALSGETMLLEILTKAGPVTPEAGNDVLVVRQPIARPADGSPGPEGQGPMEVQRVDLSALINGSPSQNILLRDGDTINVPTGEKVYVYGLVRSPGAYSIRKDTTVLQALTLAGGVSDRGSQGGTRIIRIVDGKEKRLDVKMSDIVRPGDTIVVPERFF